MAKKARKTNRPNVSKDALERARKEMYAVPAEPEAVVDAPATAAATAAARVPRKGVVLVPRVVNLREEYAYVLQDLRNMAILAAGLMIVLVLMALFIIK